MIEAAFNIIPYMYLFHSVKAYNDSETNAPSRFIQMSLSKNVDNRIENRISVCDKK